MDTADFLKKIKGNIFEYQKVGDAYRYKNNLQAGYFFMQLTNIIVMGSQDIITPAFVGAGVLLLGVAAAMALNYRDIEKLNRRLDELEQCL